jgi:hypothetical protein
LCLFEPCPARQHHVVAVLVEFDDFGLNGLADVGQKIADSTKLDERRRKESPKTDIDDKTALDHFDNWTLDHAVGFFDLLDRAPGPLVLRTLLGEDEATLFVFFGENECFDDFAQGHNLGGVDVVADAELSCRDDTFALEADVEKNFVTVDLDDCAGNDVTVLEFNDRGTDVILKGSGKVVRSDLTWGVVTLFVEGAE